MSHGSSSPPQPNANSYGKPMGSDFEKLYGTYSGPYEASSLLATITRDQWKDYQKRFQPIENQLLGFANNSDQYIAGQQEKALGAVDASFAQAPGNIARREASFGLSMTPEMQNNLNSRIGLSKSLSEVQALNTSRIGAQDQILGLMGGGIFQGNQQAINQSVQLGAIRPA